MVSEKAIVSIVFKLSAFLVLNVATGGGTCDYMYM